MFRGEIGHAPTKDPPALGGGMSAHIASSDPVPTGASDPGGDSAGRLRSDGWRTREAILDAAHASLSRDHRTTVQEIAEAAGVGRSTVYRYFPTRAELEQALSERTFQPATVTGIEAGPPAQLADGRAAPASFVTEAGTGTAQVDGVRPAGQLGREGPLSVDAIQVLDSVPPHLVAEQLVAEGQRTAGVPVALYLIDIDGSRLVRIAGS